MPHEHGDRGGVRIGNVPLPEAPLVLLGLTVLLERRRRLPVALPGARAAGAALAALVDLEARAEERDLLTRFPEGSTAYRGRVPRFVGVRRT